MRFNFMWFSFEELVFHSIHFEEFFWCVWPYCFNNGISNVLRTICVFNSLESGTTIDREVTLLHCDSLHAGIKRVDLFFNPTPLFFAAAGKHYKWISQLDFESITSDTAPYILMRSCVSLQWSHNAVSFLMIH